MTTELGAPPADEPVPPPRFPWISRAEDWLIALILAAMAILPVLEIILRWFSDSGIMGETVVVQHLVLAIGLLGGALAARENRLLGLASLHGVLKGRWKTTAQVVSGAFAVAISSMLCVGSWQFAMSSRRMGQILVYGIPTWVVQLLIPLGFAMVAWRILRHSGENWKIRGLTFVLAAIGFTIEMSGWIPQDQLVVPALIMLAIATVLGAPIFTTLGGAAVILFLGEQSPIASIAIDHYTMVVNPSLPTIPLFTLAGYFLAEGGASKRLIAVFESVFGQVRGGPAVVTILVCAFFTTFTGASGVTILALGGLLLPVLTSASYTERDAIGLLTGAGALGVLFPPCLPLILYAVVASSAGALVSLNQLFLGGLIPGLLLLGLTAWWGIAKGPKGKGATHKFEAAKAWRAIWIAKWELLLPVVALTALFSGWATPVEASAVTAVYAFIIEALVYRDLKVFGDTPRVMAECGLLVGGVLLILGVAMGFTNYLVDAQIPDQAVSWATHSIHSPWIFLLLLNGFLVIVGCLMDIFSAIIVVVPLIVPLGTAFGINPIHLAVIFLANLQLGYITPPVGMNLFLSSYRFGKPMPEVVRATLPMLFVFIVGVLLITYLPFLTTFLPSLVR